MNKRYGFYDLFGMLKENKIRIGDIIIVYDKTDKNFIDYYQVTDKDLMWLYDKDYCIFDNFYLLKLLREMEFSFVFKKEEKAKILETIKKKIGDKNENN